MPIGPSSRMANIIIVMELLPLFPQNGRLSDLGDRQCSVRVKRSLERWKTGCSSRPQRRRTSDSGALEVDQR